jgi:hypothetical protein
MRPELDTPLTPTARWQARDTLLVLRMAGMAAVAGAVVWIVSLSVVSALLGALPDIDAHTASTSIRTVAWDPSGFGFIAAVSAVVWAAVVAIYRVVQVQHARSTGRILGKKVR